MKDALPTFILPQPSLTVLAFVLVLVTKRIFPLGNISLVAKVIGAIVTLKPDEFAELTAQPAALGVIARFFAWILLLFISLVPIIIWHFRFKRVLFNQLPSAANLQNMPLIRIWKQTQTLSESVYDVEDRLFQSLNDPTPHEVPFDLIAIIIAFAYYAVGPGLFVLTIATQIFQQNRTAGWVFLFVGLFNTLIGVVNVISAAVNIRRRRKIVSTGAT